MTDNELHKLSLELGKKLIEKDPSLREWVESKLPELKEPDYNKIRRTFLNVYSEALNTNGGSTEWMDGITFDDVVKWLENLPTDTQPGEKQMMGDWGRVDDSHLEDAIHAAKVTYSEHCGQEELVNWLKSIKDRIQPQPKQEWSEEDNYLLDETISHLEELIRIDKKKHCGVDIQYYQRDIDWLKSLTPQNHWKPSEEQMQNLKDVFTKYQFDSSVLQSLYDDLKKLTL